MRISITDQFLWDVYNFLSSAGNIADFAFRAPTMRNFLPGPQNPIYKKYRNDRNKREFRNLIYYLKRKGYIKIKNLENKKAIILTKDGISKALKASFAIEGKKKRKDGKWIMLIFDIPEKRRKARNLLKSILINLGYKLLQQSVWVSPYDVSGKTEQLLQMHSLDNYVKVFIIEEI
ncbi:MAG: CRISPR-associated endonuclease Cas2 [Candidatus Staskawiczbacteria bacterium]|nr:CRISPR-associated endonuclease Cas2 [Candidatus Staskawiczbacteria bacterium]